MFMLNEIWVFTFLRILFMLFILFNLFKLPDGLRYVGLLPYSSLSFYGPI